MLEIDRVAYEAEAQYIRQALKTWETAWAREHGGAKPGRDDIKGNDIAKQYTAYNRIRGILSGKIPEKSEKSEKERQSKRKPATEPTISTPSKRRIVTHETPSRYAGTPSKAASASKATTLRTETETPSISRKLFSPVVPTSIGPTPQRDGRVLGLFDVLNEHEESAKRRQSVDATPSRRNSAVGATPRKQTIDLELYHSDSDSEDDTHHGRRMGRTPMSSGRRNLLNHFTAPPRPPSFVGGGSSGALGTTPLKSRNANVNSLPQSNKDALSTPSKPKAAPVEFATPAFLRRQTITLTSADENGGHSSGNGLNNDGGNDENNYYYNSPPNKLRLPRKPLVRGLSSVLASLRKAEDERLDEELDIMRELESDAGPKASDRVEDSQLEQQQLEELEALETDIPEADKIERGTRLLGGFDDEGLYDSEPEEAHDRGQPLRVYKKKGQKRTHRLVNMRPTRTKRVDHDDKTKDNEAIPETQPADGVNDDGNDHSDYEEGQKAAKKKTSAKASTKAKTSATEGVVKKAVRKVNELAHANFKRLKLKNTGTKGGPRFNSRFRRRR